MYAGINQLKIVSTDSERLNYKGDVRPTHTDRVHTSYYTVSKTGHYNKANFGPVVAQMCFPATPYVVSALNSFKNGSK